MWVLQLNSIYSRCEEREILFRAETREELIAFLNREKVEPYTESGPGGYGNEGGVCEFNKSYRKGGPLENFNPPIAGPEDPSCFVNVRTLEEHLKENEQQIRKQWEIGILSVPAVPAG
jgi:hypothetical protein